MSCCCRRRSCSSVADSRSHSASGFNIGGNRTRAIKIRQRQDDDNDDDKDEDKISDNDDNNNQNNQGNQAARPGGNPTIANKRSSRFSSRPSRPGPEQSGPGGRQGSPGPRRIRTIRRQQQGSAIRPAVSATAAIPDSSRTFKFERRDGHEQHRRFGGWHGDKWQGSRKVENWTKRSAADKQPFSSQVVQGPSEGLEVRQQQGERLGRRPRARRLHLARLGQRAAAVPGVNYGNAPAVRSHRTTASGIRWACISLMTGPGDMGTRIVQLAVDRHGHIAGNYYDMITDAELQHLRRSPSAVAARRTGRSTRTRRPLPRQHLPAAAALRLRNRAAPGRRTAVAVRAAGELTYVAGICDAGRLTPADVR